MYGKKCVVGVDLASEQDLTAVTYLFFPQDGLDKFYYFTEYFCPDHKFGVKRVDGVLYSDWEGEWITKTDGNVIDGDEIAESIMQYAEMFNIVRVGYDPYKAVDVITRLKPLGDIFSKVSQSAPVLGTGNALWKKNILKGNTTHDGSPVTVWQMGNIEMYTDGNGNQKILKANGKKKNKVDGPVSISIAHVVYLDVEKNYKAPLKAKDLGYI